MQPWKQLKEREREDGRFHHRKPKYYRLKHPLGNQHDCGRKRINRRFVITTTTTGLQVGGNHPPKESTGISRELLQQRIDIPVTDA
jgi:hypothetical protein